MNSGKYGESFGGDASVRYAVAEASVDFALPAG